MAFSADEKAAIRQYLGFSELFHDVDARLEGMLSQIDTRAPQAETRIRATLAKLAAVDANIDAVTTGGELTLKVAEDGVTFAGPDKIAALQAYGRVLVGQIAITLEIDPPRDYFGAGASFGGGYFLLG
jgi:hypothetical protein